MSPSILLLSQSCFPYCGRFRLHAQPNMPVHEAVHSVPCQYMRRFTRPLVTIWVEDLKRLDLFISLLLAHPLPFALSPTRPSQQELQSRTYQNCHCLLTSGPECFVRTCQANRLSVEARIPASQDYLQIYYTQMLRQLAEGWLCSFKNFISKLRLGAALWECLRCSSPLPAQLPGSCCNMRMRVMDTSTALRPEAKTVCSSASDMGHTAGSSVARAFKQLPLASTTAPGLLSSGWNFQVRFLSVLIFRKPLQATT